MPGGLLGIESLDRVEIELADHGGVDNGKLPVTFDDFVRYGFPFIDVASGGSVQGMAAAMEKVKGLKDWQILQKSFERMK